MVLPASPNFDQLAAGLSEPLRRYLARLSGDSAIAEDLLQETMVRIARGLPGFEGRSSTKTWAFSIATRVAADHFREPTHRVHVVEIDEACELTDHDIAVDQRLVVDEMNHCVREVIDSLPEDYRAALVLHDLEGHTAAEVAAVCDCSLATAKIRIHRARARLRSAMQEQCDFYRDSESVLRCDRKTDPPCRSG
ncbi:MAG TPA: RNA polymerase sigma factor [Thermoanaerobaculia bacterium]|nr:RNA polymerase sigma factor [Thermoanaerobaculia bacterium]